jgi:hypothetical protein
VLWQDCASLRSSITTQAFAKTIQSKIENTKFDDEETKKVIMEEFEHDLKLRFHDPNRSYNIKFGRERDNDPKAGISKGRLVVKG